MTKQILSILFELKKTFQDNRSEKIATEQSRYMKNLFQFYGIQKPIRVKLQKAIFKKFEIVDELSLVKIALSLWSESKRELHYAACDLIEKNQHLCSENMISVLEKLIRNQSWWDTVDKIASNFLGKMLKKYPANRSLMNDWINDPCLWIRRSALLYQLKYSADTDEKKLFNYCLHLASDNDFFIQKAIGWALREYSKTSPESVGKFIELHPLSSLSKREGMKIINKR